MRHRLAGRKLGRKTSGRIALARSLITSLFRHERIRTTLPKAKEYRPRAERLITLAKVDSVAHRRRAFAILRDRAVVRKLFDQIGPRFRDRPGGYTRILRLTKRRVGDDAAMALLELLDDGREAAPETAAAPEKTGAGRKKGKTRDRKAKKEPKKARAAG